VTPSQLLDLWREAGVVMVWVAGPVIAVALAIGLVTSVLQAATQLSDSALSFVPKLAGLMVALALGGGWLLSHLESHMSHSMERLVELGKGQP
jgi:flagellar biosynthetic protein FliQ